MIASEVYNSDNPPLFSIVIPTKDRPDLTIDLVNSVLTQGFQNFEIVISDNSLNEKTNLLLGSIKDKRLRYLKTGGLNMSENWNAGIDLCIGKYLLLFSDKMVLKKDALQYLANYIEKYSPECINWDLDNFFDKEGLYTQAAHSQYKKTISSKEIIKKVLSSEFDSTRLPCHCSSAISMSIVKSIKLKTGRACMQLNPDYTLAYQVCLNTTKVHNLDKALSILRYPELRTGYGNGYQEALKTKQAKIFMQENLSWIDRTNKYEDVRIKGNHFGLDRILKDFYSILELYNLNPDEFLPKQQRYINYYYFTYLEFILRVNMGANMKYELSLWNASLLNESEALQKVISSMTKKLKFKIWLITTKVFLKNIPILKHAIFLIRNNNILLGKRVFSSIEECLEFTEIT